MPDVPIHRKKINQSSFDEVETEHTRVDDDRFFFLLCF